MILKQVSYGSVDEIANLKGELKYAILEKRAQAKESLESGKEKVKEGIEDGKEKIEGVKKRWW